MEFLYTLWNSILDIIFGKSDVEEKLRQLTKDEFFLLMRPVERSDGTISLFRIENRLIREMIFALKYRKNTHVAKLFASALDTYLADCGLSNALLIPIPLSKKRRNERGFNQIEFVLSFLDQKQVVKNVLQKIKETAPQTTLHRSERLQNLENAFVVSNVTSIRGKNIVLVDDVTTTGATFKEASKVLTNTGVKSVRCVALAR